MDFLTRIPSHATAGTEERNRGVQMGWEKRRRSQRHCMEGRIFSGKFALFVLGEGAVKGKKREVQGLEADGETAVVSRVCRRSRGRKRRSFT